MGPACHPLCTIKLSFLGFFLAPHIWSLAFFFRSPAASQTVIPLLLNGTRMSSSMYYKTFFSWIFFGTLMTHKYRGCIVVSSISKNVDPNEEQKVLAAVSMK